MLFARSDATSLPANTNTPRRSDHFTSHQASPSPASLGILTPVSSRASLSPALPLHKDQRQPLSPPFPPSSSRRSYHRRLFPSSFELYTQPVRYSPTLMAASSSRPASPHRRERALSPTRPEHIPRPPSRCESLLRDTLRRAEEHERITYHRSASRSPGRWAAERRRRPREGSFLGALKPEDLADSEYEYDDNMFARSPNDRDSLHFLHRASAPRVVRGASSSTPTEAVFYPYGSPSSPSPMPPSILRTRTAPAVPRSSKPAAYDVEQRGALARPTPSPKTSRRSLPNTGTSSAGPQSHSQSNTTSGESSPKQRQYALSPHESVLRAKLEYVLQRAGPTTADGPGRMRKHQRAQSHGVTVVTSPKYQEDPSSASLSPQSLAASSFSNSATDLVRAHSTPSYKRDSAAQRTSPSSPPEPLTPPPTPPFNAQTASEMCKRMDGYVSFASVEGLGEPSGMDIDGDDNEESLRLWGRWWRMWPFANGANDAAVHETGQLVVGRHRSDSSCGTSSYA